MFNNQKDIQKTYQNNRPLGANISRFDSKNALSLDIFEYANKKTEKLVTALYMITDCMDTDDALKGKLRLLGVELLSDIYRLSTLSPIDKYNYISTSLTHIYEVLSFIEIAYTIGFISEMNTIILKNEFDNLASELKSHQVKDKHFTFILDEKMFNLPETSYVKGGLSYKGDQSIKDMSRDNAGKRTSYNNMSFINHRSPLESSQLKKTASTIDNLANKQERINKILSLIKDKPNIDGGLSIKDISLSFTDCSEKTIQRELNSLVAKGQLKKTGAKRWSRYSIVGNS